MNLLIKVAGYKSMNINKQNSFCCKVQPRQSNSIKLAVKHNNVRPCISSDSRRNLQSAKYTQSQEHCNNFSHKITRRVALARL